MKNYLEDLNKEQKKWFFSAIAAVLFFIIASPEAYKIVQNYVFNPLTNLMKTGAITIADSQGCPKMLGLLVHSIVFLLLTRAIMEIPLQKEEPSVASS